MFVKSLQIPYSRSLKSSVFVCCGSCFCFVFWLYRRWREFWASILRNWNHDNSKIWGKNGGKNLKLWWASCSCLVFYFVLFFGRLSTFCAWWKFPSANLITQSTLDVRVTKLCRYLDSDRSNAALHILVLLCSSEKNSSWLHLWMRES